MKKEYEVIIPEKYFDGIPVKTNISVGDNWGKYEKHGPIVFYKNKDSTISVIKVENVKWPGKVKINGLGVVRFKGEKNFVKEDIIKEFVFFPVEKQTHDNYIPLACFIITIVLLLKSRKYLKSQYMKTIFKKKIQKFLAEKNFVKIRNLINSDEGKKYKKSFSEFTEMFDDHFWSPFFDKEKMKESISEAINEL